MTNPLKRYLDAAGRGAAAELARKARIAKSTLSEIALGKRDPTLDQARRLDAASGGGVPFSAWNGQSTNGASELQSSS